MSLPTVISVCLCGPTRHRPPVSCVWVSATRRICPTVSRGSAATFIHDSSIVPALTHAARAIVTSTSQTHKAHPILRGPALDLRTTGAPWSLLITSLSHGVYCRTLPCCGTATSTTRPSAKPHMPLAAVHAIASTSPFSSPFSSPTCVAGATWSAPEQSRGATVSDSPPRQLAPHPSRRARPVAGCDDASPARRAPSSCTRRPPSRPEMPGRRRRTTKARKRLRRWTAPPWRRAPRQASTGRRDGWRPSCAPPQRGRGSQRGAATIRHRPHRRTRRRGQWPQQRSGAWQSQWESDRPRGRSA